jgi:hypothetical protein
MFESAPGREEGEADEAERYFALVRACGDRQRMAEITEAAARNLAPHQLTWLYRQVDAMADRERSQMFQSTARLWKWQLELDGPVFDNRRLSSHARLYAAHGVAAARKVLLVIFTGQGGGLFISTARFLVRLPRDRFDVLWLQTAEGYDYPHGVPGFGDSFVGVCRSIAAMAPAYAGVAAIGGSLGGFSALRAAVLLDMGAGISLSGRFSGIRWWSGKPDAPSFDPLCACAPPSGAALTSYYSADHEGDALNAAKLAAMRPDVQLVPLRTHRHNVLAHIVADGQFDPIFEGVYRTSARGLG